MFYLAVTNAVDGFKRVPSRETVASGGDDG